MSVDLPSLLISDNFDSGNIQVLDARNPRHVLLAIDPDTRSGHFQWFHFKVEGLKIGERYCFELSNASRSSYPNAWTGYRATASYDQHDWFRLDSRFDGESLHILVTAEQPQIWIAYFQPYGRQRHDWLIEQALSHAGLHLLACGKSAEGRDIQLLRSGSGAEGQRKVWIIAQQHPGEHMAEWFMEGLIQRLQGTDDPELQRLLAAADLYLVPNMNPDGAFHGHLRTNAMGQDLNRAWQSADPAISPEVFFVQQQMARHGVDLFLDIHGDEEIPYVFTAGCEGNPGYTPRLAGLEERFRSHLQALTVDFQTTYGYTRDKPGQANMTLACNSVGQTYDCLSLTLEMPFKDNNDAPDVRAGWSAKRSMQLARNVLSSIGAVLGQLR